jgi:hypothetical protein
MLLSLDEWSCLPIWVFQSRGLGTRAGLMQYVQGILRWSTRPGPDRSERRLRPSVLARNEFTMSPTLISHDNW